MVTASGYGGHETTSRSSYLRVLMSPMFACPRWMCRHVMTGHHCMSAGVHPQQPEHPHRRCSGRGRHPIGRARGWRRPRPLRFRHQQTAAVVCSHRSLQCRGAKLRYVCDLWHSAVVRTQHGRVSPQDEHVLNYRGPQRAVTVTENALFAARLLAQTLSHGTDHPTSQTCMMTW